MKKITVTEVLIPNKSTVNPLITEFAHH